MNTVVIIPTLNPTDKLIALVGELKQQGFAHFVVVDDGSDAACDKLFLELEQRGVVVLHHASNLGKGAALKTGLACVRKLFPAATHVVTADDDGQHAAADIAQVAQAANGHHDHVVIGIRDLNGKGVPARSRLGNAFSSAYFKLDTGLSCPDTQTGLRAIPVSLIPLALNTPGTRYEYEMNFLTAVAKNDIPLAMVPITTVYENRNAASHFSTVRDSVRIYQQLLRFSGSSLLCSLVDLGLFALICTVFDLQLGILIALATAVARLCSGALNFSFNRLWSFRDSGSNRGATGTQARRYAALFVAQMLASMGFVTVLSLLPIPLVAVKALVDSGLFVISYFIQRNWVFKGPVPPQPKMLEGGAVRANSSSTTIYRAV